jgi:hypothetical protein
LQKHGDEADERAEPEAKDNHRRQSAFRGAHSMPWGAQRTRPLRALARVAVNSNRESERVSGPEFA